MTKCRGCGSTLQNADKDEIGYVSQITNDLCERCFRIRHYNDYKIINKNPNFFISILEKINQTNDLVVLVFDIFTIDDMAIVSKYIKNDAILVITKRDVLPKKFNENKFLSHINIKEKLFVSSKNNYHMDLLNSLINKHKKSKNVYIVGSTNAGKSTLINKYVSNYSDFSSDITTSILPSTTLDNIKIKITKDLTLIDTPGIITYEMLDNEKLQKVILNKQIKPIIIQAKIKQTIIIDDLIRIDTDPNTLIFYMSNKLKIKRLYKKNDTLTNLKQINLNINANQDIVIKGIGFIKIKNKTNLRLYIKPNFEIYVRNTYI